MADLNNLQGSIFGDYLLKSKYFDLTTAAGQQFNREAGRGVSNDMAVQFSNPSIIVGYFTFHPSNRQTWHEATHLLPIFNTSYTGCQHVPRGKVIMSFMLPSLANTVLTAFELSPGEYFIPNVGLTYSTTTDWTTLAALNGGVGVLYYLEKIKK